MEIILIHENLVCEKTSTKDGIFGGETFIPMLLKEDPKTRVYMRNVHGLNITHDESDVSSFRLTFYVHPGITTRYPLIRKNDLAFIVLAFLAAAQDPEEQFVSHRQLTPEEINSIQIYEPGDEGDEDDNG